MLRPSSPLDVASVALAVALGALSWTQWSAATSFSKSAVAIDATILEIRSAKRQLLEPEADAFLRVAFTTGEETVVEADLPTPVRALSHALGRSEESLVPGSEIAVLYDPNRPENARAQKGGGENGALILAALAVGALFVPTILRRSSLAAMAGGGGG